jgi:GNAT superfamily N-acetyltransferase
VAGIAYRPAALDEAADILAAAKAVADEIPLQLDALEQEEALYRTIRACARSGESWVATDEAGNIVGFLLVEPNQTDRFWGESEALDLRYGGVLPGHRGRGIFTELLHRVVGRTVPLTAAIPAANRSTAARRLEAAGFVGSPSPGGMRFRREPGTANRDACNIPLEPQL